MFVHLINQPEKPSQYRLIFGWLLMINTGYSLLLGSFGLDLGIIPPCEVDISWHLGLAAWHRAMVFQAAELCLAFQAAQVA